MEAFARSRFWHVAALAFVLSMFYLGWSISKIAGVQVWEKACAQPSQEKLLDMQIEQAKKENAALQEKLELEKQKWETQKAQWAKEYNLNPEDLETSYQLELERLGVGKSAAQTGYAKDKTLQQRAKEILESPPSARAVEILLQRVIVKHLSTIEERLDDLQPIAENVEKIGSCVRNGRLRVESGF